VSLSIIYRVGKTKVNLMVVLLLKGLATISRFTLSTRKVRETKFVIIINKKPKHNLSVKEMWQTSNRTRRKRR